MKDYKDKIRKLLALAQSPEEEEAKAALLKARKLMAEHKISEADVISKQNQRVKKLLTDITCSKRRDPWIAYLATVIGGNYCCKCIRSYRRNKQTQTIGFLGLEDDIEICIAIFKYAVDCILSEIKRIKKGYDGYYERDFVKRHCNSYAYGFISGISVAFKKQQEEQQEWGLVLTTPKEVLIAAQGLKHGNFISKAASDISELAYSEGYIKGKEFDPTRRLQTKEA